MAANLRENIPEGHMFMRKRAALLKRFPHFLEIETAKKALTKMR